jgi:hypothetical protein
MVLAALGAAFALAGIVRFLYLHAFSMADALHVCIAIPLALAGVFVADYVRQHGGWAFVFIAIIVVLLAAASPAFAVGLGVALLGMSIMQWFTARH